MSIWILVGDSASARLFETKGPGRPWKLLNEMEHPKSRARGADLVTDRMGRVEERGDLPKDLEAPRFAGELAELLTKGLSQAHYERLVLVGPPKFMGYLKAKLPQNVLDQLTDTLTKDYVKLPAKELETRVHDQLLV